MWKYRWFHAIDNQVKQQQTISKNEGDVKTRVICK